MRRIIFTLLLYIVAQTTLWAGHFVACPLSTRHLMPSMQITHIMQDEEGYLWYATYGAGLVRDNGFTLDFFRSDRHQPTLLTNNKVSCLTENTVKHEIWFGTIVGAYVLSKQDYKVRPLHPQLRDLRIYDMVQGRDGTIWVAAGHGIFRFSASGELTGQYESRWHGRSTNVVSLFIDSHDQLWMAQWNGGLITMDTKTGRMEERNWALDACPLHIEEDTIHNGYWIGTYGRGVVFYDGKQTHEQIMIRQGVVNSLLKDSRTGVLWTVTSEGLKTFTITDGARLQYSNLQIEGSPANGQYAKLRKDREGNILVPGIVSNSLVITYEEENYVQQDINASEQTNIPERVQGEHVTSHCRAADSTLYIGTQGSLYAFDSTTNTYRQMATGLGIVRSVTVSPDGRLFVICVNKGVCRMDANGRLQTLSNYRNQTSLAADGQGRLWIGDEFGDVWRWTADSDSLARETAVCCADGSSINQLLFDQEGHLWVLTDVTLTEFAPQTGNCRELHPRDLNFSMEGFVSMTISDGGVKVVGAENAVLVAHSPMLNKEAPNVTMVCTAYAVDGISQFLSYGNRHINVDAETTQLTIQLSDLIFVRNSRVRFAYRLPGWVDNWVELAEGDNTVRLFNLPKGHYQLEVKAINKYGQWSLPAVVLSIDRLPAWWETWWAYILYGVLFVGFLALVILRLFKRQKRKSEAKMQERLTEMKLRFFTNISHELRTPLSLVITPLESIIKSLELKVKSEEFATAVPAAEGEGMAAANSSFFILHSSLKNVKRHADELLELVNRLLDFRKMEVGEMKLHLAGGDLLDFLRVSIESFRPLAENKGLELKVQIPEDSLYTDFDHRMMQHVVYNLLSNAVKYTDKGTVRVVCNRNHDKLTLEVADTGIGIPAAELPHIFDRYYQASTATDSTASGTGIGLHMVREMLTMMDGAISVESQVGRGCTFIVTLPVRPQQKDNEPPRQPVIPKLPTLLIADDNDDFREFLVGELQGDYNILQARNGRQALKMAQENYVDVVQSDVMMPQMDGNELCQQLKQDEQTSHIFVMLLTAKIAEESMLEGYDAGADFYLTKPFSLELLHSRLQYLAQLRQRRIELLSQAKLSEQNIQQTEDELKISPIDRRFMNKLQKLTEQHLSNPDFSVEDFAQEMAMSRRAFYRKMNALTGMTPNKYINELRLLKAEQLLREGELNISEVADRTGFADPNYFSRAYKVRFGMTPKEVRGGN